MTEPMGVVSEVTFTTTTDWTVIVFFGVVQLLVTGLFFRWLYLRQKRLEKRSG